MLKTKRNGAVIVTAYKDLEQLFFIIDYFKADYNVIIHVCKNSKLVHDIDKINCIDNIFAFSEFNTTWGSYYHLQAVYKCMELIYDYMACDSYVHIISGQDMPIQSLKFFNDFFTNNKKIYMTFTEVDPSDSNITFRYNLVNYLWRINLNNKLFRVVYLKFLLLIYRLPFKKKNKIASYTRICKGMIWASIPFDALNYIINEEKNYCFYKELKRVFIPEEFFFQTILGNSSFNNRIENSDLRFTIWETRDGNRPAILDERDFEEIINSGALFCRKVDSVKSRSLKKMIINHSRKGKDES